MEQTNIHGSMESYDVNLRNKMFLITFCYEIKLSMIINIEIVALKAFAM